MKKIAIVLFCVLVASCPIYAQKKHKAKDTTMAGEARLMEVWKMIGNRYVESPDMDNLSEEAIKAMLKALDPHSMYITAKDVQKANENLQGNFEGVGLSFQIVEDTINIVEVIAGGPSEKSGIMAGDKIVRIDNGSAVGDSVDNTFVANHLRGPKGSQVELTVLRRKSELTFKVTRDKVPIYSVETSFMANDSVGYIKLSRFARTSAAEVRRAMEELEKQGMKALMLDLRGNTGGFLDIATSVANEFLPSRKLIVYTQGRTQPRQSFTTNIHGGFRKGRLVVLIDENSASASEIVSGAIQDWDRGTIVGRRSFGKGLVQKLFTLKDGGQVRLTTARYYTPSGRCIQKPYAGGTDAYRNDLYERYKHGELVSQDSIHFPDSLKYKTASGRIVYGGGGIMPDVFVPMDTTKLTDYYLTLRNKGLINEFPLRWADRHRLELVPLGFQRFLEIYDTYDVDSDFDEYVKSKNIEVSDTSDSADSVRDLHTKAYLHLLLKAQIAKNLYGSRYYYQIMKDIDECYKKALETAATPL